MSRHAPLVGLATATVMSVGGTRLSAIAIPWLVLTLTGSPVLTGLVGFAELLPYVLAKALGGPLIDRLGARRIAIWCDWLSALAVVLVPVLFWMGWLSVWALLPAVALIGVLRAPSDVAKQALVPTLAKLGDLPLERVTGVMGASDRLAGTLGAAAGAALIGVIGPGPALLVNAVGFGLSGLFVALFVPKAAASEHHGQRGRYRDDFTAGWAVLRGDPVLVSLVVMIAFTNCFDQAYAMVLLPVWVKSSGLDVAWVGILLATFSGAAIAGAMVAAAIGNRLPRLLVYTLGFMFAGPVPMMLLASGVPLPVVLGVLLVSGFAAGFINPIIGAILFERIPGPMVGRVIALVGALAWTLMPFGGLYAGFLTENLGIQAALAITGCLYLAATLAPIVVPSFRQMNRPRQASA
ncbi:MFS transporter [Devosia sediminis]|uniref:MFS transporter n=1 Tax=Devosia sediminis TaxID=2798801 RepID=A0A934MKJ9_9HYPH|nr:MFS transporter [Devosia sediminis]MBJ3784200.1 MFS transporter [Devosia sediminis]